MQATISMANEPLFRFELHYMYHGITNSGQNSYGQMNLNPGRSNFHELCVFHFPIVLLHFSEGLFSKKGAWGICLKRVENQRVLIIGLSIFVIRTFPGFR